MTVSTNLSAGFDFDGGHIENKGVDTGGNVITVPDHRHVVSLDAYRFELEGRVDMTEQWSVTLRVPFDVRAQSAGIELVDPATQTEIDAMVRNRDLHHRAETYSGLGDIPILGSFRHTGVGDPRGVLRVSFGVSLPTGRTESNPYTAGANGEQHLHIQFGTGTLVPLLEVALTIPLSPEFVFSGFAAGRLPFYGNSHGYTAPPDVFGGVRISWSALPELTFGAGLITVVQGYGSWDGLRDVNTGLVGLSAMAGVMVRLDTEWSLRLDTMLPLVQETLEGSGETFRQGLMIVFAASWSVQP